MLNVVSNQQERIKSMRFYTVKQMSMRHPAFSQSALRALIFKADQNGLAPAITRVGRKVLIEEDKFIRWLKDDKCLVREEESKLKENPYLVSDQNTPKKSETPKNKTAKTKKKDKKLIKNDNDDQQDLF